MFCRSRHLGIDVDFLIANFGPSKNGEIEVVGPQHCFEPWILVFPQLWDREVEEQEVEEREVEEQEVEEPEKRKRKRKKVSPTNPLRRQRQQGHCRTPWHR